MLAIYPELSQMARSGKIEELSVAVRKYFGGTSYASPRIKVSSLLHEIGIPVLKGNSPDVGLIAAKDHGGTFSCQIGIRHGIPESEENFLLAHLLGHYFLDVQLLVLNSDAKQWAARERCLPHLRYTHQNNLDSKDDLQNDAVLDQFAASLLLPKSMVVRAFEKLHSTEKVALFFGTLPSIVERRLDDLMMTSEKKERGVEGGKVASTQVGKKTTSDQIVASAEVNQQSPAAPLLKGKGMERLRQLAKSMDKDTKGR
jgi:Zn-dependent peptidase ImmA (M78 family)